MMDGLRIKRLHEIAEEISLEGHNGWGNEIRDIVSHLIESRQAPATFPRKDATSKERRKLAKIKLGCIAIFEENAE